MTQTQNTMQEGIKQIESLILKLRDGGHDHDANTLTSGLARDLTIGSPSYNAEVGTRITRRLDLASRLVGMRGV